MPVTTMVFIAAILAIFATFATTMAYGQMRTRGIVAPGARKPD